MLSIRSQNRTELVPYRDAIKISGSENEWCISTVYTEWNILGTYKSKERCLEILDEIENCIVVSMMNEESVVYRMPKE